MTTNNASYCYRGYLISEKGGMFHLNKLGVDECPVFDDKPTIFPTLSEVREWLNMNGVYYDTAK